MHGDRYFCFVVYTDNEQEEAGDTLVHTFIKRPWPVCETRWFYFWGSIAGLTCQSTTSIFELHFAIQTWPVLGYDSNRSVIHSHINWNTVHDAASGTTIWIGPAPDYLLRADTTLTVSYWIYRAFLFFNTSTFPTGVQLAGAFLSLYAKEIIHTASIVKPNLCITQGVQDDPVTLPNYGDQLPHTTVGGQKDLRTFALNQYNDIQFNADGLGFINLTGWTDLCLRTQLDIEDIAPPLGTNRLGFSAEQAGIFFRPILTLCYPPS